MHLCASQAPSCASAPARRLAPWPSSASSPTRTARTWARSWPSALSSRRRSSGCSRSPVVLSGASCARSRRGTSRSPSVSARWLRATGRLLLRSARAHRCLAPVAPALHVPGDGGPGRRRARAGAAGSSAPARARTRVSGPRPRAGRGGGRQHRSAWSCACLGGGGRLHHVHPCERRVATRVRPGLLSALVCTGAALSLTGSTALLGQLRPADVTGAGWDGSLPSL